MTVTIKFTFNLALMVALKTSFI